jgi:hypothetical protein
MTTAATAPLPPSTLLKSNLNPAKKPSFGNNLEFEDDPLKNSSSSVFTGGGITSSGVASGGVPSGAGISTPQKKKVVLVEEPRKMQAERPALLLDLSQSKLLLKYKQENISNNTTSIATAAAAEVSPIVTATTAATVTPDTAEVQPKSNTSPSKSTHSNPSKKSPPSKTNSLSSTHKKLTLSTIDAGGVYGAEEDNGGVYGADPGAIVTRPPPQTIAKSLSKTNSTESKRKQTTQNNNSTCEDNEANETDRLIPMSTNNDENNENNLNTTNYRVIPSKKNSLIVEETDSTLAPSLTNVDCSVVRTMPIDSDNTQTTSNMPQQNQSQATTGATPASSSRKQAFNPLYVILKDKNKYHTTEYI